MYNARKRGLDRASEYFKRTENIAGVKDMRFQALVFSIAVSDLHMLGVLWSTLKGFTLLRSSPAFKLTYCECLFTLLILLCIA